LFLIQAKGKANKEDLPKKKNEGWMIFYNKIKNSIIYFFANGNEK
jgi:hypothetical protein